jgi:hypothetical protein
MPPGPMSAGSKGFLFRVRLLKLIELKTMSILRAKFVM